jgi:hypothetical protein
MRDSSRIAYAQARVQARFSRRPLDLFWRELEAGRDLPHLIELVRPSALGAAVDAVAPDISGHALEARLRRRWRDACMEIAGWYPPAWRPAMQWLGCTPWMAGLEWIAQEQPPWDWMTDDPVLGGLVDDSADARDGRLAAGPFAPLADAMNARQSLAAAWHAYWRSLWPPQEGRLLKGLEKLDLAVTRLLPGSAAPEATVFDASVDLAEDVATRVFRRLAGTPVAGVALLVLLGLDHARLRAALVVAGWFRTPRAT